MKAYKFLLGIFALAAIAIACDDDEEDYVIPAMSIDKTALSFDETGGATAAQTVYVTSNRDWEATCDADWVFFSPTSARASDNSVEVSVYVDANTGTDRTAKLTFDGATVSATVTVSQTGPSGESYGDGTVDNPYTIADALSIINAGSYTSKNVYVKGFISKIDEIDTSSYGNATYYISDDGTTDEQLEVYRGYSLGGAKFTSSDEIQVGDEVIVYGELTMYGTTPEVTQGSSIYYLNGVTADVGDVGDHELVGDGTVDNPYTATDALWLANDGSYTSDKVYVKGIISGTPEIDTSYGNATYYISDDGSTTNRFEIYRGYSLGGAKFTSTDEIKEGDEVIVYGEITMYYTTPEMTTGSSIYSLNGVTSDVGGGDEGGDHELVGDGTADNPYTAADALWLANSGNYTDDEVYVKGIISQIDEISTSYGNATYYISDDGETTEQFEIYRGYSLDGAKFTSENEIEVGDKVVVCGVITMFYSTPEMTTGSKIVSLEKGDGNTGGDEGGDTGDIVDATAAEVNAGSDGTTYRVAGYITSVANTTYGNFYLKDYTDQTYIYGTLDASGNTKNWESLGISAGDIVKVHGPKSTYGSTAELTDVTVDEHYAVTDVTIAEFNAASVSTEVYYRLTGTVTSIASTTYGNLYLEDETASVYVYGLPCGYGGSDNTFSSTGVAQGDVITIVGTRGVYGSTIEVLNGFYVETVSSGSSGGDTGGLDLTGSGTLADPYTASDALALVANDSSYDQSVYIKGIVSEVGSLNSNYNELNYYISDDGKTDNQLYVYCGYGLNGEKIYSADYLSVGDELVIYGELKAYNGSAEVNYGSKIITINGDDGNGDVDDSDPYVQNVTWTLGNHASNDKAYINGSADTYDILKLGTSTALGDASCTVPAGTKALHFYCIGWNGKGDAPFKVTVGEESFEGSGTQNSGLANSSPYTLTLSDSDYFEFELSSVLTADTTVTFETTGNASSNGRVGVIGFKYVTD